MCITNTNIHKCGHEVWVDTPPCKELRRQVEIAKDEHLIGADHRIDLDKLLVDLSRICTRLSREEKTLQDFDCEACLKKAGLKAREEGRKKVAFFA
jgi:hypothetical protein